MGTHVAPLWARPVGLFIEVKDGPWASGLWVSLIKE